MDPNSTDVSKITVSTVGDIVSIGGKDFGINIDMRKAAKLFEVTGHYMLTHSTSIDLILNPKNFYKFLSTLLHSITLTPDHLMDVMSPMEYMEAGAKIYLLISKFVPSSDQMDRVNAMLKTDEPVGGPVPNEKTQSNITEDSGVTEFEDSDLLPKASGL